MRHAMKKKKDSIAEALDIVAPIEEEQPPKTPEPPKVVEEQALSVPEKTTKDIQQVDTDAHSMRDYIFVRNNLKDIAKRGLEAIDGILQIASESEQPRAYEVASQLIKSVSETNKDILELHAKMKGLKADNPNITNNTTNAIYVGSTKDLQELINTSRSAFKQKPSDQIIDAEVVDSEDDDAEI